MQKFFRILIIILLFFMCLLIGAKLANITLPENQNQSSISSTNQDYQFKILIFVVDDLSVKNPTLISAWSLILYYQDAKGLMIIPLVINNREEYKDYKKAFVITSENKPHDKTIKFFNTKFKTKWVNYLVLDNFSANYLFNWMVNNDSDISVENQPDQFEMIDMVCQKISSNQLKSLDSIEWNSLSPTHFLSNFTIQDLNDPWQILSSSNQLLCDQIEIESP